jgi:hypothetical protein
MQWNELAYIREIETALFYKNSVVHVGKFTCSLYTARAACGKNVGRAENARAVRKVKKGKIKGGINVGGENVCTDLSTALRHVRFLLNVLR